MEIIANIIKIIKIILKNYVVYTNKVYVDSQYAIQVCEKILKEFNYEGSAHNMG